WSGAATNSTSSSISSGTAKSTSTYNSSGGGTFTIAITDVSVPGYTYNPSANAVTRTYISTDMISYSWAGYPREYYLHVPLDKPTSGMPLLFALHGSNQSEIFTFMGNTTWPALGDKYGFAVVYPQSYLNQNGNYWWTAGHLNDGPGDDTGFLTSLAQDLQTQYGFSPDYTFVCGFSNGGGMSYRLACEASDVFAGAAPVAGYIAQPIYDACNPSNTVSVIATHGTSDLTVRYNGVTGEYPSAPEATNYWAQLNGCTDTTVETLYGGALERTKHTGGLNGSEVWLHTWGGSHAWNSPAFDTSEEIWAFFDQVVMGGGGSYCGDGTCDPGEDQCNCSDDCGTPPATETVCDDGIDDDCDGYTDCDDIDCDSDPACQSSYCGDGTCDPGEDPCNCSDDCGTPPATETNCTDGIDEDCDGQADCDDADCDGDPACDCLPNGSSCSSDSECCSNKCRGGKCR
ncbi:MAG: CE1 family esterase, partial [Planctomycetota bacterium]